MAEQVIDASIAIKWVEYEVESILQRRLYHGRAAVRAVDTSLNAFYAVGVQVITHPGMVRRAREIARQFNQERIYDSLYAALAELRGCQFWTADRVFYDAVKSVLSFVRYLPDYQ